MKLCLGVIDMPYGYGDDPNTTTSEVARDLEDTYELFTCFYNAHQNEILTEVKESLTLQIANHIQFGVPLDAGDILLSETILAFSLFLEREEMAGLSPSLVPTLASILGVNSRLKQETGIKRPSFIDGGLLLSAFTAWIETDES